MDRVRVLIYGDHLGDKVKGLQRAYTISRTNPIVEDFLHRSTDALKALTAELTPSERERLGDFADLQDVAASFEASPTPSEAASFALTVTAQVAELLQFCLSDSTVLAHHHGANVQHFGVCLGLLAACLAATARSVDEVARLGVHLVAVAFRLGLACQRRSQQVEASERPWARTFLGAEPKVLREAITKTNKDLPVFSHASLGVVTSEWTTVFAPPTVLARMEALPEICKLPAHSPKVSSCVHAPHLTPLNTDFILGTRDFVEVDCTNIQSVAALQTKAPSIDTFREALFYAVSEIANCTLYLEDAVHELASRLQKDVEIELLNIGLSTHATVISKTLQVDLPEAIIREGRVESPHVDNLAEGRIAIVGMSGRFPRAENLAEFWSLLEAGMAVHEEIPPSRFSIDDFHDPLESGKNTTSTKFGCFLQNPGLFDNWLFNISPKEAMQMDPLQRMLLMSTYEALQQAGYSPNATASTQSSRMATFFGQTTSDWNAINEQQGIETHYISGTNRAFAPGRINHFFELGGGSYSIDTACSASSTSMHLASNALLARECDTAIVGGGQLCTVPDMFAGLSSGGFLSATGACKTFADDADGYCRGEAVGVVVLKRLADAVRENDNVLAVVCGTARNSNGVHGSIVSPHQPAQEALFGKVLRQANIQPSEVDYVEMHGTGTQAGDTAEMESVMNVFSRPSGRRLHIGAVKANVGHSEAAAGIVALIKTVLMLQKGLIPPQPSQSFTLNRQFRSLEKANILIPRSTIPWSSTDDRKRIALINGFDAAGGNTSILLKEGHPVAVTATDLRSHHVIAISGHTSSALQANKQGLSRYLLAHPDTRLCDLSYTTTARRVHERERQAFVVDSLKTLQTALNEDSQNRAAASRPAAKNVAFLFTGQSSQYTGMGSTLYQTSNRFRELLDSYQAIASSLGLPRFVDILRGLLDLSIASASQQQLSIVALEIALAEYWRSLGLEPNVVLGHSLGEYAALCCAGVLSVSSTLFLVHRRAELMEEKCASTRYSMLAIGVSQEAAQKLVAESGSISVACLNGPDSTVLSGAYEELAPLETSLKSQGISAMQLKVQYGFHSRQMDPILADFEQVAEQVHFGTPQIPIASTCTGKVVQEAGTFSATYLKAQSRQPVEFQAAIHACEAEGLLTNTTFAVEIGPHPVCIGLLPPCLATGSPNSVASLQRGREDWRMISAALAAAYSASLWINWTDYHKDFKDSVRLLDLPSYAWDLSNFWAPYETRTEEAVTVPHATAISSSVQRLESLRQENGHIAAIFVSNTSEPVLYQAIQGHAVSGTAICPASVFMDMAYTAARFLYQKESMDVDLTQMELQNLRMTQALLVPRKDPTQTVRITAQLNTATQTVSVRFQSVDGTTASGIVDHGHATIVSSDKGASQRQWSQMRRLVQARTAALASSSQAHRMTAPLIYKLFAGMVDYSKPYQRLRKAHVDDLFQDAMASIELESTAVAEVGNFTCSPFTLDALVHLVGFLLNADLNKTDTDLHMANHIGNMHILRPLRGDHHDCVVYASIRDRDVRTGVSLCDVFVFEQATGDLVAVCSDIKFQRLPLEVFSTLVLRKTSAQRATTSSPIWTPETTPAESASRTSSRAPKTPAVRRSEILLGLTASELGIDVKSFRPDTDFEDLGLHSMATLKITAAFRKETGVELPVGIFAENGSVGRMKAALDDVLEEEPSEEEEADTQVQSVPSTVPAPPTTTAQSEQASESTPAAETVATAPPTSEEVQIIPPPAQPTAPPLEGRVVLVQGDRTSPLPPVFLATAGIGLAAPYIRFPRLAQGRPIYALESPYVECPELHSLDAVSMAAAWIRSVKKIARKGPYILGGYSGGGAWAYEIGRQLAMAGDAVAGLLIIDCRVPQPVPSSYNIIAIPVNATGLTDKNKVHMIAGARTLVRYSPDPYPPGREPGRTHLIWCEGGEGDGGYGRVALNPIGEGRKSTELTFDEYQAELNRFFCGKREKEDFGTNGWEEYVGGKERMRVRTSPGNHSSMMRPPHVKRVGELLVEFVEDLAEVEAEMIKTGGKVVDH